MAQWCNSLCDFCKYDRDVTAAAMSCVDRYAATPQGMDRILMDRDQYQLAVMTSLYMVAKVQQHEALDPDSVAKLSRGKHTKRDIEAMEMTMLSGLKWRVHPPTPWTFAQELLKLVDVMDPSTRQRIVELTKYQLEATVYKYELTLQRPSVVAFGAVLNAMESLNVASALQFESMVSRLLQTEVPQLRDVRVATLKVIAEDAAAGDTQPPECVLLTQRMNARVVSPPATKETVSRCGTASPVSVSATIR
jgi:hypothetical protein